MSVLLRALTELWYVGCVVCLCHTSGVHAPTVKPSGSRLHSVPTYDVAQAVSTLWTGRAPLVYREIRLEGSEGTVTFGLRELHAVGVSGNDGSEYWHIV